MTVLPNAPIDPDTGLPNPTIAIGTGGGISITLCYKKNGGPHGTRTRDLRRDRPAF